MENNKVHELLQTYTCPEKNFSSSKQLMEKKSYIKKAYPLEFGSDGITLLQRGPWTQQEREIYLQICQKHMVECKSNVTKQLFSEILQEIPTRNLTQLVRYHKYNNPFPSTIIKITKRIKRNKQGLSQNNSGKLLDILKKKQRNKVIKQQENLANVNNYILTKQTQMVQFNLTEVKQREIKIYINIDLLFSTCNEEQQKQVKKQTQTLILDCVREEPKEQFSQIIFKKDKILVSLRNSFETKDEEFKDEFKPINQAKRITFKELISKVDVEYNLNHKKQLNQQNFWQRIDKSENKLNDFIYQQGKEVIIIEQEQDDKNEIQQIQVEQFQQKILPQQAFNDLEVLSPKKKIRIINNQKSLLVDINEDNSNIIFFDSSEKKQYQSQESCLINTNNQFDFQQYLKIEKQDFNQQITQENKSGQNTQIIEQNNQGGSDEDINKKKNLNDLRNDKKDNINNQSYLQESSQNLNDNEKIKEKQQQQLKKIESEKECEIKKQKYEEEDMESKKEVDKKSELELEKIRINQQDVDKQKEIERKKKLESLKIQEKEREEEKKNIQALQEHDRKERYKNRNRNRDSGSLQKINQPQNEQYEQVEQKCSKKQQQDSSFEQSQLMEKQLNQKGQEIINQQQLSGEILNQQYYKQDFMAWNQNQYGQDFKAYNQNQQGQDFTAYNQSQFGQDFKAYSQNQYRVPYIDQIQQQQFYHNQLQRNQFICHNNNYQPFSVIEGQYQNQSDQLNINQGLSNQDQKSFFTQQVPAQYLNYHPYQVQAISQPQALQTYQPSSAFIRNPYYYPQIIPVGQIQQQSLGISDGSQNVNKDQYQVERMYLFQRVPQQFGPNCFFQYPQQSFISIPDGSNLEYALK